MLPAQLPIDRSREAYKDVLYPQQLALRFIPLTLQNRAGLCLGHLISSPPWPGTEYSTVLTFIEYVVNQLVRQCP